MSLLNLNKKTNTLSILYLVDFLFFLVPCIFSIFLYPVNNDISYLLLILIIFSYSLLNMLVGFLQLDTSDLRLIPILSLIAGMSYWIYILSVLFESWIEKLPVPFKTTINLSIYLRPCVVAVLILLVFLYFFYQIKLKIYSVVFLLAGLSPIIIAAFFTSIELSSQSLHHLDHLKISMIIILFLGCSFFLWKQRLFIERSTFIFALIISFLILISEVLIMLNTYYPLDLFRYISLALLSYLLYTIHVQSLIIFIKKKVSNEHTLHRLNSQLMNKVCAFQQEELKNLQTEASKKDELYQQLFNFAPDAFFISVDGIITYTNQATISLLNASNEKEIINTSVWDFIHPDSILLTQSLHKSILKSKTENIVDEIKIKTLDQKTKDVRVSATRFYLGDTPYTFSSLHDLANDKAHQLIQAQLKENIAHEKYKVEFFANISHDLKTPINVIYSAAQLQYMCADEHDYEKVKMYNQVIKQNCLRLQKLLNDLLDLTKLDANHFKPCLKLSNIIYTIENITQSVTSYVKQKSISIIFDTNVEEKIALTDPYLIDRILLNLISNAIKYGKKDGNVWVTLYDEGNHLIISVKDDGIGIPPSHIPNIFQRFNKVTSKGTHSSKGNGIGLSLVKSIVDILDGEIFCLSKEGEGSEFVLILPMISYEKNEDYIPPTSVTCSDTDNNLDIELSDT